MQNITRNIQKYAEEKFGIKAVKPFQLLVMHRILEQENFKQVRQQIVILPTGTGKSLCFLLPAVMVKNLTIIVYPLLALMNDQMKKLKESGIDLVCIRGDQTKEERRKIFDKIRNGTLCIVKCIKS